MEILATKQNFAQKSKFWTKIKNLPKILLIKHKLRVNFRKIKKWKSAKNRNNVQISKLVNM